MYGLVGLGLSVRFRHAELLRRLKCFEETLNPKTETLNPKPTNLNKISTLPSWGRGAGFGAVLNEG